MPDVRKQAVTGLVPPDVDEATIRERWPSVSRFAGVATLGRKLTNTIVLAPLAWLLMAPFYFSKVLPILARRYTLTNRRVMIRAGWSATPIHEAALADIDDVRIQYDDNSGFFRAANIEIVSNDKVILTLPGTPEPETFRTAIFNARNAWVPGRVKSMPFVPASSP